MRRRTAGWGGMDVVTLILVTTPPTRSGSPDWCPRASCASSTTSRSQPRSSGPSSAATSRTKPRCTGSCTGCGTSASTWWRSDRWPRPWRRVPEAGTVSDKAARPGAAVFELAVRGELGPVLRGALRPFGGVRTEALTILRVGASGDRDVAELVRQLHAHGLECRRSAVAPARSTSSRSSGGGLVVELRVVGDRAVLDRLVGSARGAGRSAPAPARCRPPRGR